MFCKRCGNENPEDAVYCIKCGYNMWDKNKQKPPTPNPSTESVSAHVSVPRHEHTHKPASIPAPSLARRVYPPKLIAAFILIGAALLSFFLPWATCEIKNKKDKQEFSFDGIVCVFAASNFSSLKSSGMVDSEEFSQLEDSIKDEIEDGDNMVSSLKALFVTAPISAAFLLAALLLGAFTQKHVGITTVIASICLCISFMAIAYLNSGSPYRPSNYAEQGGALRFSMESGVAVALLCSAVASVLSLMSDSEQKKNQSA